jgi:hypothetical protein
MTKRRGSARRGLGELMPAGEGEKKCQAALKDGCFGLETPGEQLCYIDTPIEYFKHISGIELEKDQVFPAFYNKIAGLEECQQRNAYDRALCHINKAKSNGKTKWDFIGSNGDPQSGLCNFTKDNVDKAKTMRGSARRR